MTEIYDFIEDNANEYGIDESAVMTFAETLYEAGYSPDQAVHIAWGTVDFLYNLGVI